MYSVIMFVKNLQPLFGLISKPENPLIPKHITYYVAFPSYFIIPYFAIIMVLSGRIIITKQYNFKVVYALFSLALLVYFYQSYIYEFIMDINPYTS